MPKLDIIGSLFRSAPKSGARNWPSLAVPFNAEATYGKSTEPSPAPERTVAILENGMRFVAVDNDSPVSCFGLFMDTGSRHEPPELSGISHFLEHMAFKSNSVDSSTALVRMMGEKGANIMASAGRDHTIISGESPREHIYHVIESVYNISNLHIYDQWEIDEVKERFRADYQNIATQPDIMDTFHAAAYSGMTLGQPIIPPLANLDNFNTDTLSAWARRHFAPSRMVLSAIGVPIQEMEMTAALFTARSTATDNSPLQEEAARYTGGEVRSHAASPDGLVHYVLGFETANWHDADLVPLTVLQMMMGGGGSFSAGGPGKGMYSRLYTNVLNQYHWAHSVTSFTAIYKDSGLFGLYGQAEPHYASDMVAVLVRECQKMAGPVSAEELSRAKNQLKSAMYMHLESRGLCLEDLGRQTALYGKLESPDAIAQRIDAVTDADIQRVAGKMLKQNPTVAAHGDLRQVPRFDEIAAQFK